MEDAFEDHFVELWRTGLRVAYRLSGNRADAEDMTADTLADAFRAWGRIRELTGWVARVVARRTLRLVKSRWLETVAKSVNHHLKAGEAIPTHTVANYEKLTATLNELKDGGARLQRRRRCWRPTRPAPTASGNESATRSPCPTTPAERSH